MKRWYVAVDLDRCLLDTEKFYNDFMAVVSRHALVDWRVVQQQRYEIEKSQGSFDGMTAIRGLLPGAGEDRFMRGVISDFLAAAQDHSYLYDGAKELVEFLHERGVPWGILTFGGQEWQKLKLQVTGLDRFPHLITDQRMKAKLLKEWLRSERMPVRLGSGYVTDIVLVDDKLVSFQELPQNAYGILVGPTPADGGIARVVHVDRIGDVSKVLESIIDIDFL